MAVGVKDGRVRVADGQALGFGLTVSIVACATVDGEVRRLVDERSGLGISTGFAGVPEGTAKVDRPELIGIWSRDLSALNINITAKCIRTDVGEDGRISAGTAVVGEAREIIAANRLEVAFDGALAIIGVGAEPSSVSVRAARDTGKVRISIGSTIRCVSSGCVDLRFPGRRASDECSPFAVKAGDGKVPREFNLGGILNSS